MKKSSILAHEHIVKRTHRLLSMLIQKGSIIDTKLVLEYCYPQRTISPRVEATLENCILNIVVHLKHLDRSHPSHSKLSSPI